MVAHIIDSLVAAVPAIILSPYLAGLGSLIGSAYMLLRDALPYALTQNEAWRNKSVGKRLLNLEVDSAAGQTVDWAVSAKRNLPFVAGNLAAWMPTFVGPLVGIAAGLIVIAEIVLVLSDSEGRRLGDRWAETQVIQA